MKTDLSTIFLAAAVSLTVAVVALYPVSETSNDNLEIVRKIKRGSDQRVKMHSTCVSHYKVEAMAVIVDGHLVCVTRKGEVKPFPAIIPAIKLSKPLAN